MPRAGLDPAVVIARAAEMLDSEAGDGLNLVALAASLGVRPPSLYKHIDGAAGLERGVMLRAKAHLTSALEQATIGRSREDAIRSLSIAYRRWALEHPGQYPLTVRAPKPGDDEDLAVSTSASAVVFAALSAYGLSGDDAIDATRFLRSALHGFVALETGGAFELPVDRERSFLRLVESVVTALSAWSRP